MLHLYDRASIEGALTLELEPRLRQLLAERIGALDADLLDRTEVLIVEPGDTEEQIVNAIRLSPLVEPFDGIRYRQPGFWPHWDWLTAHDGWFEMLITFGSTFAYVLLIQNADGVPPDLLRLCRAYVDGDPPI